MEALLTENTNPHVEDGNWHLVHAVEAAPDGSRTDTITSVAVLTEAQKDSLLQANREVQTAINNLQIIDAVHANVEELIETVVQAASSHFEAAILQPSFKAFPKEVARRLLNLCASFNSMIKQHDALLTRQFGRRSAELQEWQQFKLRLAEERFEYALIYGLRNFIEHVDMPPVQCSINRGSEGAVTVEVNLERDAFLTEQARLGERITQHFHSQDEAIPLWPLLQGWHDTFREIATYLLGPRVGDALSSAATLCQLRESHGISEEGEIGLWFVPDEPNDPSELQMNISWLLDDDAERLQQLLGGD